MKILAIDSSAVSASCAVTDDLRLISQCFANVGLTHSETLLTLIDSALTNAKLTLSDIDLLAVTNGPGSFTGIRIGVSTVKGLSFTHNIPCVGVSTLESIASGFDGMSGQYCEDNNKQDICCCVMDARRNQVYNALFNIGQKPVRICEDRAIDIEALAAELEGYGDRRIILCGDGADMCFAKLGERLQNIRLAPAQLRWQTGYGVASAALRALQEGCAVDCEGLNPVYLRPSQAERELKKLQES